MSRFSIALKKTSLRSWARGLGPLLLMLVIGAVFNPSLSFFHWSTHRDMLRQISVYGILATAMTVVIVSGGIDLAVGSILALTSVTFSILMLRHGWSAAAAITVSLSVGATCGLVSGFLISRFKMQAFIATLAMMVFARGLAKWIADGQKISTALQQADGSFSYVELPQIYHWIDHKLFGGNLAVVTVIFLCGVVAVGLLLSKFRLGRYLYATGGNEDAAKLSGVPVNKMIYLAYGISGLLSAVAGICQAAQEQQGDPEAAVGYELTAIAIVVLGGTSLSGGNGNMTFTLIGALTIGYLEKILSINAVGEPTRLMITGAIIVSAVILQQRQSKLELATGE